MAVLSVILFHLDRVLLPGGYIGVDIFFVISGFLITGIISREIAEGRFSFSWFYVKRMRRILPVFYTVTLATVVVGAVLLLPKDVAQLMASARHAVFFVANRFFAQSQGYFDIAADEKPLLHTWSLAIEEQYYLIWPLLLLATVALCGRLLQWRQQRVWPIVAGLTLLLALIGTLYAQMVLVTYPGAEKYYFQIQTRFSELMIGAFIALVPTCRSSRARRLLTYSGLAFVVIGLTMLTDQSRFPGINALLPCVGAALIIHAGPVDAVMQHSWLHRVLGMKPMRTIGLWSYSLYLWHWPIFAYMRYVWGDYRLPAAWMISAIVATFVLSWLTYTFIEQRTRHVTPQFRTAAIALFALPALAIVGTTWAAQHVRSVAPIPDNLSN